MKNLITFILLSILTVGCNKEDEKVVELKSTSEYYPLTIGSWYVYDVDSIFYNDFTDPITIDSLSYQVKEELTDTFYDLEGTLSYKITRSKRSAPDSIDISTKSWELFDIWSVKRAGGNIQRVEENNRYVSLIDPISEGNDWNGNAFNDQSKWDFTYENVGDPFNEYSDALIVNQKFFTDNKYFYQNYKEVYAKGIGLVSRTRIDTESQSQDVINNPEKGFKFYQVLNSYFISE